MTTETDKTLTEIIKSKGLEADQLTAPCDDSLFVALTKQISRFDEVGFNLGLTEPEIQHIKRDRDYEEGRIMAVLLKWRSKVGSSHATHLTLTSAFLNMGDRETTEFVLDRVIHQKSLKDSFQKQSNIPFTPQKDTSKYPNWDSLSKDQREQIKTELLGDNEKVKSSFGFVVIDILNSFQHRNIDHRKVKIYLQFALSLQFDNIDLESSSDLVDVFSFLAKRCSWYNFELFESIVNKFGVPDDISLLLNYITEVLQPYLKRSIFEIPPCSLSNQHSFKDTRQQHLFLKLPDHDLSGADVKLIQTKLAKRLQMSVASFELCCYRIGCIEFEFSLEIDVHDTQQMMLLNECTIWDTERNSYVMMLNLLEILVDEEPARDILQKIMKHKDRKIKEYEQELKQSVKDAQLRSPLRSRSSFVRSDSESSYVEFASPTRTASISGSEYDYAAVISLNSDSTFRRSSGDLSTDVIKEETELEHVYSSIDEGTTRSKLKTTIVPKLNDKNAHKQAKNWFMKNCNKRAAIKLLYKQKDGTFLCRPSDNPETLPNGGLHTHVIDVMVDGTVKHIRVLKFSDKYGLTRAITFDSVMDLVLHYSKNSLESFSPNIKQTLAFPVNSETHYEKIQY